MSDGLDLPNLPCGWRWTHGPEALEARKQVLMQQAAEAMDKLADGLTEPDELPISSELRRKVCIKLCAETFDQLKQKESHSWVPL
jgi:hypothetical protein